MTIDWIKAEEKPDKKQAVESRILLELRSKCDYLKEKLEEANENLFQSKEKLYLLSKDHEKSSAANRREIKEKEEIINNLKIKIDEIKIELEKYSSKVSELEFLLKEKEQKFLLITNSSGSEISRITSELEDARGKISELETDLNRAISINKAKDEEIRQLAGKVEDLSRLTGMIEDLDTEKNNLETQLKNLSEQKESEIQNLESALTEKNKLLEAQAIHIEEVEKELEMLKPTEVEESVYPPSYGTRIICPRCEAKGKSIRTVDDKKTVLSTLGNKPMYAKKYVCINCNYDWQ